MTLRQTNPAETLVKAPRDGLRFLAGVAVAIAAACALPMLAVLLAALVGGTETVRHLLDTVLPAYAGTTLLLVVIVAGGHLPWGWGLRGWSR